MWWEENILIKPVCYNLSKRSIIPAFRVCKTTSLYQHSHIRCLRSQQLVILSSNRFIRKENAGRSASKWMYKLRLSVYHIDKPKVVSRSQSKKLMFIKIKKFHFCCHSGFWLSNIGGRSFFLKFIKYLIYNSDKKYQLILINIKLNNLKLE